MSTLLGFPFSLPLRREAEKPNAFFPSLNKQGSSSSSSPRLRMTDSFPILTPSLSHSLEGDPGTKSERGDSKSLHADFGMFLGGRGLSGVCLSIRLVSLLLPWRPRIHFFARVCQLSGESAARPPLRLFCLSHCENM